MNGEKTVFVWDGDQMVLELSEGGKVKSRYIRGNDLVYTDRGESTEKQFYVTDPHGNVVRLTDENGKVVKTYEYDSFGNEVKPDSKDDNPFRYCGEYYDKETEEIYLRARYYQPSAGRFLTGDSYTGEDNEPESLHLYAYCGYDGVNAWDPSGHKKIAIYKGFDVDFDGSPYAYAPETLIFNGKDSKVKNPAKPLDKDEDAKNENGQWVGVYVKSGKPVIRTEQVGPVQMAQYYVSILVVNNRNDIGRIFWIVNKNNNTGKIKSASVAIGADINENIEYNTQSQNALGEGALKLLQNLGKRT